MPRASGVQTGKGSRYRIAVISGVLSRMEKTAGVKIDSYKTLKEVLKERIRYFDSVGCLACDHSFSYIPYEKCGEDELEEIFRKGAAGRKTD